ncbi:MAG: PIN domain-containing protein [Nitrososphaerota archaeon]|nr:PIN domain-containing protein [Nitrososphaerota archaeon]MDG7026178.1 PIN domain-containing protein [Nitrososphaerota archaeon]
MIIETDLLFSHVKSEDWLKKDAETILRHIATGKLGEVYVSREAIHELYYLLNRTGHAPADILAKVGALTRISNLTWVATTTDDDLLALSLITTYGLSSVFDSYHAAACLLQDPEHTMISTDEVYDKIPRIKRIDPRKLAEQIREPDSVHRPR